MSQYKDGFGKYTAAMTFNDFMAEWDGGDDANIPFAFNFGNLWIFQPRKEVVYSIYITNSERHMKKIKSLVKRGLKELKNQVEAE